jgi:hypothetical protein
VELRGFLEAPGGHFGVENCLASSPWLMLRSRPHANILLASESKYTTTYKENNIIERIQLLVTVHFKAMHAKMKLSVLFS